MQEFANLIEAFNRLPPIKRDLTFMQVAGYPHYENVCSNILAFFLDPKEEHQMGDLLLQAVLRVSEMPPKGSIHELAVEREYQTPGGTRIDLVLTAPNLVIGLENKIYHWLANDLEGYAKTLENLGGRDKTVVKILLGLHIPSEEIKGGFKCITYLQLWEEVEKHLGRSVAKASPKWLLYFLDFISTTKALTQMNMDLSDSDRFFIQNEESIERLLQGRQTLMDKLAERVRRLTASLTPALGPRIYATFTSFIELRFQEQHTIVIDTDIGVSGWTCTLFGRNSASAQYLERILQNSNELMGNVGTTMRDGRHLLATWPLEKDLEEIRNYLESMANQISAAEKTLAGAVPSN